MPLLNGSLCCACVERFRLTVKLKNATAKLKVLIKAMRDMVGKHSSAADVPYLRSIQRSQFDVEDGETGSVGGRSGTAQAS